jgi:hypothetical protein
MQRTASIVIALAVLGVFVFLALTNYEMMERLELRARGNFLAEHIDKLWFSPGGELVGIGWNDSQLIVRVWPGNEAKLLRERTISFPEVKAGEKPVFAVSADASSAAWIDSAGVHAENLISSGPGNIVDPGFRQHLAISALAFAQMGRLAALYRGGDIEIRDLGADRVTASRHLDLADPALLITSGSYLAAYSSASGDAFVFDTGLGDKFSLIEHHKYPRDILSLNLSPQGRFAVATSEKLELPDHSIPAPGPIRTFAFIDRERVLAAGDFAGILLLSQNQGPQQVWQTSAGTTAVAANGLIVAASNGSSLALLGGRVVRGRVYKGTSRPSPWLMIGLLGLLSPVAIYFSFGAIRQMFKKTPKDLAGAHQAKELEEEGPIPNALVEACKNGDCVLWAGAGLGAQAGLPTWAAFLRELVEWTAKDGVTPAGVTGAAIAELAGGKTGAAADRIAAAFENREHSLHLYFSQRFRTMPELSQAHRLIKEIDFPALVTTSLDMLLDRTFPYSGGRVYTAGKCSELIRAAARGDFLLLKPFGDVEDPDTIRIGPAQCSEILKSNTSFSELMEVLFQARVFLFLGASLEGIERDLGYLDLPAVTTRKHYALVPDTGKDCIAVAERLSQRYGIEALAYSPSSAQHPEVVEFLTKLIELIRQKSRTQEYFEADG